MAVWFLVASLIACFSSSTASTSCSLNLNVQILDMIYTASWNSSQIDSQNAKYNVYVKDEYSLERWTLAPDCENITTTNCTLKLNTIINFDLFVKIEDNFGRSDEIFVKDIYDSEQEFKYSPLDFDLVRKGSFVEVIFHPRFIPWWNQTVPEQLISEHLYSVYNVEYGERIDYSKQNTPSNASPFLKIGEIRELISEETASTSFNLTNPSQPICVRAQFVFEMGKNTDWNMKCLEGFVEDEDDGFIISKSNFEKYKIYFIAGCCVIFFLIFLVLVICCGKQFTRFRKKMYKPQASFLHENIVRELRIAKGNSSKVTANNDMGESATLCGNIQSGHGATEQLYDKEIIDDLRMDVLHMQIEKDQKLKACDDVRVGSKTSSFVHNYVNERSKYSMSITSEKSSQYVTEDEVSEDSSNTKISSLQNISEIKEKCKKKPKLRLYSDDSAFFE